MDSNCLKLTFHTRHSSKAIKQFTTQTRKEKNFNAQHKFAHMNMLLDVWNQLPSDEKSLYTHITDLYSKIPSKIYSLKKENSHMRSSSVHYSNTYAEIDEVYQDYSYKIYIGNLTAANDEGLLNKRKIRSILTLEEYSEVRKYPSVKGGYMTLEFNGGSFARKLEDITRFIDNQIQSGNVLVHYIADRSVSLIAILGYLMKKRNLGYLEAYSLFTKTISIHHIGPEHIRRLKQFERLLKIP